MSRRTWSLVPCPWSLRLAPCALRPAPCAPYLTVRVFLLRKSMSTNWPSDMVFVK